MTPQHRARAVRAFTGLLLAATTVLAPAATRAQAAELAPGLKTTPLQTVVSSNGRTAVADRLIVVFAKDTTDDQMSEAHRAAATRGKMAATPLRQLGPSTQLVDVSGAASLNAAMKAYQADPRVRFAALVRTSCGLTSEADQISGTGSPWQFGRVNALRAVCFPAPSNLRVSNFTSNSVEIQWTDGGVPADSSTEVHYRPHNSTTWTPQVLAANRTSWLHQGLASGAGYDYKVRDCDANGCSAFTNIVTGFAGTTAFTLTVGTNGRGTVESVPSGINCPGDCSEAYPSGTVVTLHAEGYASNTEEWQFTGWSGGGCSGRLDCTVTMSAARSVTATFSQLSDAEV